MRLALKIGLGVALAGSLTFIALAQKRLTPAEAKEHVGETATVCGEVVSTYPGQVFTIVIWGSNRSKFGAPETDYNGKRICVTGKIAEYRVVPEIVADDPKQIRIDAGK